MGPTRKDVCAHKGGGGIVKAQKGTCNLWNLTSPNEAHRDAFIRSDLLLMCRCIFSHCCLLCGENKTGENKTVRGYGPKVNNIYIVGVMSL